MATTAKTNRIELRVTERQKSEIEHAAALMGRSITDFSVSVLVKEAEDVILRERDLMMSDKAWDAFNKVLDEPAKSLEGLKGLLSRPSVFTQ
jgi:uncharacterized protein (DUF1778 family)